MYRNLTIIALFASVSLALVGLAYAEAIDYGALEQGGFGDVAALVKSMTPEQRAQLSREAALKEQDLKKMSPQQLQQLRSQLRAIGDTIDMGKIDPAKLDISKSKDSTAIQKDLATYQAKYDAGKIHNGVVKPSPGTP